MGMLLTPDQFLLVTLLMKIGAMASIASLLVRSAAFKRLLFSESMSTRQGLLFALVMGVLLSAGVLARLTIRYNATDLSLSGTLLVGLLAGFGPGCITGACVGIPAAWTGELLALPMGLLYGLTGGLLRRASAVREEVWEVSPFPFMNFVRFLKTWMRSKRVDWKVTIFVAAGGLELLRILLSRQFGPGMLFALSPQSPLVLLAVLFSTPSCLAVPLKIWNNTRVERLLERQTSQLLRAQLDALRSQINPHFLFNTLNTISSAIRSDPEQARSIVLKLSNILRHLLSAKEDFVPVSEELELIDAYLDIEAVRFGEGKLHIEKEIDPDTLGAMIPSMLLQPIVENAVKHGIAPKIDGGTIRISTRMDGGHVRILVEDDGVGIPSDRLAHLFEQGSGIGISNVNERLKGIFGPEHRLNLESGPGRGVRAVMAIPVGKPAGKGKRGA
ncbi:MAG: histidine kinase [Candidatus Latescibacterota bacterium]